ncbi:SRPBCC family protein [Taklimakanibacter deserti]|uniref:SRPBCC family protein n=1 Tax=Taklimakanibacter deserti TaxID=2267839 RepID=UPI000E65B35F
MNAATPKSTAVGLKVSALDDREILMTRLFDAPRDLVFDAFTKPHLIKRWLTGPDGWSLPVCEVDLKVGGRLRYEWRHTNGTGMGMSGTFREIERPERIVHVELFDEDWTGGEAVVTTVFTEQGNQTLMRQTILYGSRAARDAVLKSPMEQGVAQSYDRLAALLAALEAGAA